MSELSELITNARKEHELNRADFAALIGVADGTVGMWEADINPPALGTLLRIKRNEDLPAWVYVLFDRLLSIRISPYV
jgi:transcriptional regulator with XRE-family HTH domain